MENKPCPVTMILFCIFFIIACFFFAIKLTVELQFGLLSYYLIPESFLFIISLLITSILFLLLVLFYHVMLSLYRSGVIGVSIRRFRLLLIQIYNHIKNSSHTRSTGGTAEINKNLKNG